MPEFEVSNKDGGVGPEGRVEFLDFEDGLLLFDAYSLVGDGEAVFMDLDREEATKIRNYLDNWLEANP